jgi:hypothetical protein
MIANWPCPIPSCPVEYCAPPGQAIPRRLLDHLPAAHAVLCRAQSSFPPLIGYLALENHLFCDTCQALRSRPRHECHVCQITTPRLSTVAAAAIPVPDDPPPSCPWYPLQATFETLNSTLSHISWAVRAEVVVACAYTARTACWTLDTRDWNRLFLFAKCVLSRTPVSHHCWVSLASKIGTGLAQWESGDQAISALWEASQPGLRVPHVPSSPVALAARFVRSRAFGRAARALASLPLAPCSEATLAAQ